MKPPILARFDFVYRLHDMAAVQLERRRLWQIPAEGQTVNIDGNPYRVFDVGWALPDVNDDSNDAVQYAYVKVQKASDFTVTIGGRVY
jgi:hypothetical protein